MIGLAIHGGAGTLPPSAMDGPAEHAHRAGLARALAAGYRVLAAGGPALDAVVAAIHELEDDPLFNAGIGAVLTADGTIEHDACLMNGADRRTGAVAGICGPRHPIDAARAVMEHSPNVLLAGRGAEAWLHNRVPFEPPAYFITERRQHALAAVLSAQASTGGGPIDDADRHGTVGAVARDARGGLAAGTSTGGMTGKLAGRIGDAPIAGAGTWADGTVAISCTGHGESFIRAGGAQAIAMHMRLGGLTLAEAASVVLADITELGGDGGLVAIDATGRVKLPFTSRGMYRGRIGPDGVCMTGIYHDPLAPTPPPA